MTTPKWAPGELYPNGSIVVPRTQAPTASMALTNPGFEDGATDWTLGPNCAVSTTYPFTGSASLRFSGGNSITRAVHAPYPVAPGRSITASAQYDQGGAGAGHNPGTIFLRWYTAAMLEIGDALGNTVDDTTSGGWKPSTVTASAPANAAFVAVGFQVDKTHPDSSNVDAFTWDYGSGSPPAGLVYRAVQPAIGTSAENEPVWPGVPGVQVVDNDVIWEGVLASRVVWEADPILLSGLTEPTWPESPGEVVADNTIKWVATSRDIDTAPDSDLVVIGASKVFVGDDDIVPYSATANPLDRTSPDDAGYLPSGLQQYGANPVAAMALYRSDLIVFNAEAFQRWQIDENPENMALMDALPVGSTRHYALCPVSNDLFFLSSEGVRTIGIAGGSTNLQASDVGMPIDTLVQEAVRQLDVLGYEPIALYYPSAGQYWLCCNTEDGCQVFVYTMVRIGQVGAWSRYLLPFRVDDWAIKGDSLFVRSGDSVHRFDDQLVGDQLAPGADAVPFHGLIQWPWLDMGQQGATKRLLGVDVVCEGAPTFSVGYDERNPAAFTAPYTLPADSMPGMMIPMEVTAVSMSIRLAFTGLEPWHFKGAVLYLADRAAAW